MDEVSVAELAGRLVVSLGVVLAIMFVAALLLKRSKGAGSPLRRRAAGPAAARSAGAAAVHAPQHAGGHEHEHEDHAHRGDQPPEQGDDRGVLHAQRPARAGSP